MYWPAMPFERNHFVELLHLQMWVFYFRRGKGYFCNTNNGIERMNQTFKYEYLGRRRNHTLSYMIDILIRVFIPGQLEIYLHLNVRYKKSSALLWTAGIPEFLKYRPPWFVKHCLKAMTRANNDYPSAGRSGIEEVAVGVFTVSIAEQYNTVFTEIKFINVL